MVDDKWKGQRSLPWLSGLREVTEPGQRQVCDRVQDGSKVMNHRLVCFPFFSLLFLPGQRETLRSLNIRNAVRKYCPSTIFRFRWFLLLFFFV